MIAFGTQRPLVRAQSPRWNNSMISDSYDCSWGGCFVLNVYRGVHYRVPLPILQRWLGHSDIKNTMVYLQILSQDTRDFYEALEFWLANYLLQNLSSRPARPIGANKCWESCRHVHRLDLAVNALWLQTRPRKNYGNEGIVAPGRAVCGSDYEAVKIIDEPMCGSKTTKISTSINNMASC